MAPGDMFVNLSQGNFKRASGSREAVPEISVNSPKLAPRGSYYRPHVSEYGVPMNSVPGNTSKRKRSPESDGSTSKVTKRYGS